MTFISIYIKQIERMSAKRAISILILIVLKLRKFMYERMLRNKGEGLLACDLKVSVKRIARFLLIAIINFG